MPESAQKNRGTVCTSRVDIQNIKTKAHPPRRVGVQYVSSPGRARTYNNSVNSSGVIDHVKVITTIVGTQDQATVCAERCAVQGQNLTNNAFSEMNYSS